jgi:hypothetical protein
LEDGEFTVKKVADDAEELDDVDKLNTVEKVDGEIFLFVTASAPVLLAQGL